MTYMTDTYIIYDHQYVATTYMFSFSVNGYLFVPSLFFCIKIFERQGEKGIGQISHYNL